MNKLAQICRECTHILDMHYEDAQCGKVIFTEPTEKEIKAYAEAGSDFGGSYGFCKCTGYKP